MQDLVPVVALAAVAVVAVVSLVVLTVVFLRRERGLRLKLGSCRTSLEARERALSSSERERDRIRRLFNQQAGELARYRGAYAPDKRLTRTFVRGLPEPAED